MGNISTEDIQKKIDIKKNSIARLSMEIEVLESLLKEVNAPKGSVKKIKTPAPIPPPVADVDEIDDEIEEMLSDKDEVGAASGLLTDRAEIERRKEAARRSLKLSSEDNVGGSIGGPRPSVNY